MSYFLVDDQLHASMKRLKVSTAALGLWVCAGSWSRDKKTGGYIPREALRALAPDLSDAVRFALAAELVDARIDGIHEHGFWLPLPNGWQFHGWDEQYSDDEIDDERHKKLSSIRAEAGRRGAQARWSKGDGKPDGKQDGKATFANGNGSPSPQAPLPLPGSQASSPPDCYDWVSDPSDPSGASDPKLTGSAREGGKPSGKSPFQSDAERLVFEHWAKTVWRKVHPIGEARATPRRVTPIRGRLREKFTVEQLTRVCDSVAQSKFHLGENDTGKAYIEPQTIFRNREKVEEWLSRRGMMRGHRQPSTGAVTAEEFERP